MGTRRSGEAGALIMIIAMLTSCASLTDSNGDASIPAALLFIDGTDRLIPGADAPLRLMVVDSGSRASRPLAATWTTSDSTVVRMESSGMATELRSGEAWIVATSTNVSVRLRVTVAPLSGTIAYHRGQGAAVSFIRLDGSPAVSADLGATPGRTLSWSPDGTRIAYDCVPGVCLTTIASGGAGSPPRP